MQDRKRETADALQNVGGDSSRKRRAITHTFIIIALSGTVCKGKKSSAKRVFTGSYGILTNRPYAAFHRNSKKDSEEEGKSSGTMLTEIGYIKGGIDRIERKQDAQDARYISMAERMSAVESSAKSAHHRIDRLEGREAREDG